MRTILILILLAGSPALAINRSAAQNADGYPNIVRRSAALMRREGKPSDVFPVKVPDTHAQTAAQAGRASAKTYDLIIYGGTAAAVIAAVQAKRMGKSVVIVSPDKHLGGLSSGGLGFTDTGDKSVIGGLAREFYHRVWRRYQQPDAWKWEKREQFGNKGQGTVAMDGEFRTM
jgi:hypothetical protein